MNFDSRARYQDSLYVEALKRARENVTGPGSAVTPPGASRVLDPAHIAAKNTAAVITAGVDVQRGRIEVEVVGWNAAEGKVA